MLFFCLSLIILLNENVGVWWGSLDDGVFDGCVGYLFVSGGVGYLMGGEVNRGKVVVVGVCVFWVIMFGDCVFFV